MHFPHLTILVDVCNFVFPTVLYVVKFLSVSSSCSVDGTIERHGVSQLSGEEEGS